MLQSFESIGKSGRWGKTCADCKVLQTINEFLDLMIFSRGKIIGDLFFFVILGIRFGRRARRR
jgi:hypothetical protein